MNQDQSSDFERVTAERIPPSLLGELGQFLWQSKKWWMAPIILMLILLALLISLSGSAAAPFIYTLF
jgi:hypothetical protein